MKNVINSLLLPFIITTLICVKVPTVLPSATVPSMQMTTQWKRQMMSLYLYENNVELIDPSWIPKGFTDHILRTFSSEQRTF